MSERSTSAALGTLMFSTMSSRRRSVVVLPGYPDGLCETDGSSHPSDTKNSSIRLTVSV